MEFEIVTFVVTGKCVAEHPSRSTGINPEVLLFISSLIPSSAEYIWPRWLSKSGLLIGNMSLMYLYVKLNWDANFFFFPDENKDCMNSASYEYRNMSTRGEAQFVPIGMVVICWETFPPNTTIMLSTRNSSILLMSTSMYLFFESECSLANRVLHDLKPEICICDFNFG